MAKKKPTAAKAFRFSPPPTNDARNTVKAAPDAKLAKSWVTGPAIRETIESLAIAFVLAFVFRAFDAEAFVIPTGSMAPTLMGQHKDLLCPKCGYRYAAGASSEDEQLAEQRGRLDSVQPVVAVSCPLCRYMANVDPSSPKGRDFPTYGGDRILVSKYNYDFQEPRRWDVVVFKYPGGAQMNYIKRLVGLPNETVRLWHGDVYVKADGQSTFQIERRPPDKLRAMAQMVYDNDYVVDDMTDKGWPLRWQPTGGAEWQSDDRGRSFHVEASPGDTQWLRYQHFVPTLEDWKALGVGNVKTDSVRPRLVTDFYAYDSSIPRDQRFLVSQLIGLHWVGDLMLECDLDVTSEGGQVVLDLVKGGQHFRCEIDCQTGRAQLAIDGLETFRPQATTAVQGAGRHRLAFANIDEQLTLWVDDSPVEFDAPTSYEPLGNDLPRSTAADPLDLAPAGIGARGCKVQANRIRLWRDIYYIAVDDPPTMGPIADYSAAASIVSKDYNQLVRFWSTPAEWSPKSGPNPFEQRREAIFRLEPDQFFMLGDNSPASQDARLWDHEKYVHRDLLVGKALIVFWPHSFNRVPGTGIPFPFFPNFARMGLIR